MKLFISPEVVERYPSYRLTLIAGMSILGKESEKNIGNLLEQQEEHIRSTVEISSLPQHPHIASWREVYASFGAKPSKYRCAVESLTRAILKRGRLPRINSLVNLCNFVSIKHVLPIDIMDLDNIEGDIGVCFAKGDERFLPLGTRELEPPEPGEVIYSDAVEVLGRRWNWRKSEKSKVETNTKTILITIEGIREISTGVIEEAETELSHLLGEFFDGTLTTYRLNAKNPQVNIME